MATPDLVNLSALIDDAKCFALVRQQRWPEGVRCPACGSSTVCRGRAQGATGRRCEKGRSGRRGELKATPGRGTLEKDKPPVLSLIQRGGQMVLRMLANVRQKT